MRMIVKLEGNGACLVASELLHAIFILTFPRALTPRVCGSFCEILLNRDRTRTSHARCRGNLTVNKLYSCSQNFFIQYTHKSRKQRWHKAVLRPYVVCKTFHFKSEEKKNYNYVNFRSQMQQFIKTKMDRNSDP